MASNDWIALGAFGLAFLTTFGLYTVWLVRLEGKTTANAVMGAETDRRLAAHVLAQDRTHDDLIRVQEQLKHLTNTMQQWMATPQRTREP